MAKRFLSLFLTVCLLMQLLAPAVQATGAVPDGSGVCGEAATYTFSGGTLTVTGTGEIAEGAFRNLTGITRAVIEEGITGIGKRAFMGCTGMESISLPATLTHIREYAFASTGLTELTLPEGLTDMYDYVLENTPGVKALTIPASVTKMRNLNRGGALNGSSVETLTFAEGIAAVPRGAARGATKLESVTIPGSAKSIGDSAFQSCTALRDVTIENGVEEFGYNVFTDCTSLTSLTLPESMTGIWDYAFSNTALTALILPPKLKYLGGQVLAGNTGVKELTIPATLTSMSGSQKSSVAGSAVETVTFADGMKRIPDTALMNASSVKTVNLPDSLTTVGSFAFVNTTLPLVVLPEGVTTIEMYAFYSTEQVIDVVVPDSVSLFGSQCFADSPNLTVLCSADSPMARYCIQNAVTFRFTEDPQDAPNKALDRSESFLTVDADGANINGQISYTLRYALKEGFGSRVSGQKLLVRLPVGSSLLKSTLTLNGELWTDFSCEGTLLTVPVSAESGELKFRVQTKGVDNLSSYAGLSMIRDGESAFEMIGYMQKSFRLVSMDLPEVVAERQFTVTGHAPAEETVTVTIDGVEQGTAKANKAGSWQLDVTLSDAAPMSMSTVTATCGELTQVCKVVYNPDEPVLKSFTLTYNGAADTIDLLNENYPLVYFVPGTKFVFRVEFDNPELIERVTVVSNRSNRLKTLEAKYDEESGAFITDGYFDPKNRNYVPGSIYVEYSKYRSASYVGGEVDWDELQLMEDESALTVHSATSTDVDATVSLGTLSEELAGIGVRTKLSCYDASTGTSLSDWMGLSKDADNLLSYTADGYNGEKYLMTLDYSAPNTYLMIVHDITNNTYVKMVLETVKEGVEPGATATAMKAGQVAQIISDTSDVISLIYEQKQIEKEMNDLRREIHTRTDLDAEERKEALRRVDELENGKKMFAITMAVIPMIAASPVVVGAAMSAAPLIVLTGLLAAITLASNFFWDASICRIRGEEFYLSWVIDPSGYVYDTETGERLPGVTTTAYYIPSDGSDTFFDTPPAEDRYGEKWDASEYDQNNPLLTNSEGKYAWDVPEGWWRVKYEKFGYETVWSQWLPVPPPQTEVNIGMTPTHEPHTHSFGLWIIDTESVLGGAAGTKHRVCACGEIENATYSNPLTDVPNGKYFTKPIFWAYENGITKGKTATEFQRDADCTRKQIVMFLWRAAGQPEPASMENPFTDIKADQFQKAILWAYHKGITSGKTATEFQPEAPCTREQIVMFLWRYFDKPAPDSMVNPFTDVKVGGTFEKAILWAYYEGITTGKTATTFEPQATCTRGQIVTFLYRAMAE